MKKWLIFLFALGLFQHTKAQSTPADKDTLLYYLKNSGQIITQKDSADYVRLIIPPDTVLDRDLYRVYDYLPNGKIIMAATSLTKSESLLLDGRCFFYYPNGKPQAKMDFTKGVPKGYVTRYYPNGQIYTIMKVDINDPYYNSYNLHYGFWGVPTLFFHNNLDLQVIECRDSTGKVIATNGNGYFVQYTSDFKSIIQKGNLVNNKAEGDWTGPIADTGKFVITYHKGEMKYGVSYMNSGKQYKFKQSYIEPDFSDGRQAFFLYLKKNTIYPESAKKRKIEGTVAVRFYVELNGTLSDVQVVESRLTESINQEAIRVIKWSPLWIAGSVYGVPTRMPVTVHVGFYDN